MFKYEVEELELAREIIRELGREIEKSDIAEDEMELKLDSVDSVEGLIVQKLKELLK